MNNDIILVGGGGHCKSAIELIRSFGLFNIAGIVDIKENIGKEILGIPVIGTDDDIFSIRKEYSKFVVTIGQIKSHLVRERIFNTLKEAGAELPVITAKSAFVSETARVGEGTMIFHQAVVNAEAAVGVNCIINNLSLVEHDCVIGDHCHLSTGALLNGNVHVGKGSFIGSNACIIQGIEIGEMSVIGAGSLVVKNVMSGATVTGVPAVKFS